ncbi:MAG: hypothetical protein GX780_06765 [Campylobacteraceae bacterium]|nr:hypothetical protein [Campylobacteraceae bacterium]
MRLIFICFLPIFLWAKSATLSAILDGDTLLFLEENSKLICQLAFIDAPELEPNKRALFQEKSCKIHLNDLIDAGEEAASFVAKNVSIGQKYNIEVLATFKDGWASCIVHIPQGTHIQLNPNLNALMLDQGYAVFYNTASSNKKLVTSMKERATLAKKESRGLWKNAPKVMNCLNVLDQ